MGLMKRAYENPNKYPVLVAMSERALAGEKETEEKDDVETDEELNER